MATTPTDPGLNDSTHDWRADDPRLEDPAIDAPWKELGPRENLTEEEVAERAARPDSHSGS